VLSQIFLDSLAQKSPDLEAEAYQTFQTAAFSSTHERHFKTEFDHQPRQEIKLARLLSAVQNQEK
jgi:hypothetical protein